MGLFKGIKCSLWGVLIFGVCVMLCGGCMGSRSSKSGSDSSSDDSSGVSDTDSSEYDFAKKSGVQKRLVKKMRYTTTESEEYEAYEYEYDSDGNLSRKNISGDCYDGYYYIYTYSDNGQMTEKLYHTDGYDLSYEYEYDSDGHITGENREETWLNSNGDVTETYSMRRHILLWSLFVTPGFSHTVYVSSSILIYSCSEP